MTEPADQLKAERMSGSTSDVYNFDQPAKQNTGSMITKKDARRLAQGLDDARLFTIKEVIETPNYFMVERSPKNGIDLDLPVPFISKETGKVIIGFAHLDFALFDEIPD